jgi:hypothetical protein
LPGGAPVGNKNATKNKAWEEALRRALLAEDGKKLRSLADKLIERAEAGDVTALKEIGDRIDGKPSQSLEHSGPDGEPLRLVIEK